LHRRVDREWLRDRAFEGRDPTGLGDPARLPPAPARRQLADLRRGGPGGQLHRELQDAVRPRDPRGVLRLAARAAPEEGSGDDRGAALIGGARRPSAAVYATPASP